MPSNRNLTIDAEHLWSDLMTTAQFGATAKGGINRLTLSVEDKQVRDWFREACAALGCRVEVDAVGNMFARRPGRDATLPPIAMGSHLDTQPTGGKFDGILGVLAGLEVLRTLERAGVTTQAPLVLCNWTNEEGSRFAPACLGSRVFAGDLTPADAEASEDRTRAKFGEALRAIGYVGDRPPGHLALSGYFELHIEQGPLLEADARTIGIVTGIQGVRWYEITVTGRDAHAGTTPMPLRSDAMVAAARMVTRLDEIARTHGPSAVATVGLIEARPNSRNVVPGEVFFTVDLRHPEAAMMETLERELRGLVAQTQAAGFGVDLRTIWDQPPIAFDARCIEAVRASAVQAGLPAREMVSGAGHDAGYVARVAPTAMIFVPCKDGLSHNEAESATKPDCGAGAQVLLDAVLRYDDMLASRRAASVQ